MLRTNQRRICLPQKDPQRHTDRWTDRRTEKDRQTNGQTDDRQTGGQTDKMRKCALWCTVKKLFSHSIRETSCTCLGAETAYIVNTNCSKSRSFTADFSMTCDSFTQFMYGSHYSSIRFVFCISTVFFVHVNKIILLLHEFDKLRTNTI